MAVERTKYYVLDENLKSKQVSEVKHAEWITESAGKYNKEWANKDGSMNLSLTFSGIKESGKEIALFKVHSVLKSDKGKTVNEDTQEYANYKSAVEAYDLKITESGEAIL